MDTSELKQLLKDGDPAFWEAIAVASREALDFGDLFLLSSLRKKAHARALDKASTTPDRIRLGYSL